MKWWEPHTPSVKVLLPKRNGVPPNLNPDCLRNNWLSKSGASCHLSFPQKPKLANLSRTLHLRALFSTLLKILLLVFSNRLINMNQTSNDLLLKIFSPRIIKSPSSWNHYHFDTPPSQQLFVVFPRNPATWKSCWYRYWRELWPSNAWWGRSSRWTIGFIHWSVAGLAQNYPIDVVRRIPLWYFEETV